MKNRKISITKFDFARLKELLAVANEFDRTRSDLKALAAELDCGHLVESKDVAATVITMNSRFKIRDLETKEEEEYTLVFPADADFEAGRISVLSPIGTALLGYSEGETVEWPVPAGKIRIKIEKVLYQPEAAGDFHL
ncbi:MAG: nucleoside diphosphate kinase regulator [Kiritimatiellae bacterium]|nr:nucleoside diphosphate kinase regulator [Kiritimatiellia bacterium]